MKTARRYWLLCILIVIVVSSCRVAQKKNNYINENYNEIKSAFPDAEVSIVEDSIKVIFPDNVVFDEGSASLKNTFEEKLNRFGKILEKFNQTNLLIAGYTDSTGDMESNVQLSLTRANNVKYYLTNASIKPERLFTWGLGQKKPLAPNDTEEGRVKNRRVEFVVLYSSEK